jgi:hypothetical protein
MAARRMARIAASNVAKAMRKSGGAAPSLATSLHLHGAADYRKIARR